MPHAPLESVHISESSNFDRTVVPFSPEDYTLIVRCGGVEKANGEYRWSTERREWQKIGFIISPKIRTPDFTPVLWEGQGRWELCMCCNDGEGGGKHIDVLYFSVPTNGNLPFINGWRSVAPEYLPPPVISLVEINNGKNMLHGGKEALVLSPYTRAESSFQPLEFSCKGEVDDRNETVPFIVLKRKVTPCHVKILEGKDTRWSSGRTAPWNKSIESFSISYNEDAKKGEEAFQSTEWDLPAIALTSVNERISSIYENLENYLEEARCAMFNVFKEEKRAPDSIMIESEAETLWRIVPSLNTSLEGTPSPTSLLEAAVNMSNMNLEGNNNSLLWSMVEDKERLVLDSCSDVKRQSKSGIENLAEEQLCNEMMTPLPVK